MYYFSIVYILNDDSHKTFENIQGLDLIKDNLKTHLCGNNPPAVGATSILAFKNFEDHVGSASLEWTQCDKAHIDKVIDHYEKRIVEII
jgi:hypothetical protein